MDICSLDSPVRLHRRNLLVPQGAPTVTESEPVTEDQLFSILKDTMKKIPQEKVYFTLKRMRQKPITRPLVQRVKACIALDETGVPINSYTVKKLLGVPRTASALYSLHNLGDRNILTMVRGSKITKNLRWVLNPLFLKHYKGTQH